MRKILFFIVILTAAALGTITLSAQDATTEPTGESISNGVSVTIYNQGTALVQDRRTFDFDAGLNLVNFTDVASGIDPTSVSFKATSDPLGTTVLEQNYVFDLVNSSALLARYLDEMIQVTLDDASATTLVGQLLSGRGGEIILRKEDGQIAVVSMAQVRDIHFPNLPEGLITRPTLRWLIESINGGEQNVELTYLTTGINWTADYVVILNNENSGLNLNGWITLTNTSGTAYRQAQVKLVAGDVNRLPEYGVMDMDEMYYLETERSAREDKVQQRDFNQYKLYEIGRAVTVGNNETKQVEFVTGAGVPAITYFVYESSPYFYNYGYALTDQYYGQSGVRDVQSWLEFTTAEENGLGADLPAGRIRVYQEDIDGAALLIGENVEIYLGNAFDLVGERTQTDFQLVSRRVLKETYEIRLRNRKDNETVQIRVPERLFRWSNWEILSTSHEYQKLDSNTIEYRVDVEPGKEVVITYTVQYSWP
jgi:hypothetical protein